MPWLLSSPTLILGRRIHRDIVPSSASVHLVLHIGSVLDVLVKATYMAGDFVPGLKAEGDEGDCAIQQLSARVLAMSCGKGTADAFT